MEDLLHSRCCILPGGRQTSREVWAIVGYRGCGRSLLQAPAGTDDRTGDSYLRGGSQAIGKRAFSRGYRCSISPTFPGHLMCAALQCCWGRGGVTYEVSCLMGETRPACTGSCYCKSRTCALVRVTQTPVVL